jgi:hypothetical protein
VDDLEVLAMLLAKPEPSGDVIGRGRDQLTDAIRAPARLGGPALGRRRTRGLVAGAIGLTAAVAAVVILVASGLVTSGRGVPTATATVPAGTHSGSPAAIRPRAVGPSPGQKVLLAAAATALRQRPGTYWHFKIRINAKGPKPPPGTNVVNTYESWIARDGKYWNAQPRCAAPPGTAVFEGPGYAGFSLGKVDVTYQVTRRLPTNPAALTAWVTKFNPSGVYGPTFVATTLISLLWQVPAPPAVRAAAFRALAALPGVTSLGPVRGGVGLLITFPHTPAGDWIRLVVDPATSLVRRSGDAKGTTIIHAQWTNRLPRIIGLPPKNACEG